MCRAHRRHARLACKVLQQRERLVIKQESVSSFSWEIVTEYIPEVETRWSEEWVLTDMLRTLSALGYAREESATVGGRTE